MTTQAESESCCYLQGCSGWPHAGSTAWFESKPRRFKTDLHPNPSPGPPREPQQVPGWGWGSHPEPTASSRPLWLAGSRMRTPYQLQQQTRCHHTKRLGLASEVSCNEESQIFTGEAHTLALTHTPSLGN